MATPLVVGVTGHRDLRADETVTLRQHVHDLLSALRRAFPRCPLWVLSPLAEGSDQLVAAEALTLGAKLIAPLPLERELYAADFAQGKPREHFDALCAQATVIELPLIAGHSREAVSQQGIERTRQYAQAGVFVARHCHLLLALWDGKPSAKMGGTAQIVDYYLSGRLPGRGLDRDEPLRLYGGGDERMLCHLVCSRDRDDGAPAHPWQPGQVLWRDPNSNAEAYAGLPPDLRAVFMRANEFNGEAARYAEEIAAEGAQLDDGASSADDDGDASSASAALFRAADWLALHFQRRVLLAMRVIYVVAFIMGVFFTIYDNLSAQNNFLYVFLFLFATGGVISAIAKRRGWHRKYLDYRALAEGLRVQCYLRRAGVAPAGGPGVAHDSLMQKQDVELGWVRNVMRSAGLAGYRPSAVAGGAALDSVIDEWVGDETRGELGYYERRTGERARTQWHNEMIGGAALLVGVVVSVLLAIFAHWISNDGRNVLLSIMAVFSIFAAVREAYSFRKADRELIRQYRLMQRVFINARAALDAADDDAEQRAILLALGEAALTEHVQWAVMHRQRPLEAGKM